MGLWKWASERDLIVSAADLWGLGGYPAPAAWFRSWAQKIAELNLSFCEQQPGPLKSLVCWFVRWGYGGSTGRPLGRISCHRGTVCSLLLCLVGES